MLRKHGLQTIFPQLIHRLKEGAFLSITSSLPCFVSFHFVFVAPQNEQFFFASIKILVFISSKLLYLQYHIKSVKLTFFTTKTKKRNGSNKRYRRKIERVKNS